MLQYFLTKKLQSLEQGFTLMELIVVSLIVGILSAVSIPGMLGQVGKARETEASSQLATINRSQMSYHFEFKQFAPDLDTLSINVIGHNYNYPDPSIATNSLVKHQAIATPPYDVSSRNFSTGTYHNSGVFVSVLCRAVAPTAPVLAPDTPTDVCSDNGTRIE